MRCAARISPDDTRRPPVKHALRKWLFSLGKRSSLHARVVVVGEVRVRAGLDWEPGWGRGLGIITWLGGLMGELIKQGHAGTVRDRARRQPTWIVDRDFNVKRCEPATLPTLGVISEQCDLRHAVGGSGRGLPN